MSKRTAFVVSALILLIGVFYLATIRAGQEWSDDFAMYVHHAENIVSGVDYRATGYLYDPLYAVLGPRFYPPGYPLLLAPLVGLFGLDLLPMKIEGVLFFLAFLAVLAGSLRRRLSLPWLAGVIAVVGLNPVFWGFKDGVTSDIPFLFFTYLALALAGRSADPARGLRASAARDGVWVGLAIAAAVLVRSIGLILVPAVILADLWRRRRLTLYPLAAGLLPALAWWIQGLLIPGDSGYADMMIITPQTIRYNLSGYLNAFLTYWSNGYLSGLTIALAALLCLAAAWGLWRQLRREVTVYEFFLALYLGVIILWRWNQGVRFLIPLIPLVVVYTFQGAANLPGSALRRAGQAALPALILLAYAAAYTRVDFGPFPTGVEQPPATQLFAYLRDHTRPDDVFLFAHPRALALYTDRSASGYNTLEPESYTLSRAEEIHLDYAVVGAGDDYLRLLVKRYPQRFEQVYTNEGFSVYRYLPPDGQGG